MLNDPCPFLVLIVIMGEKAKIFSQYFLYLLGAFKNITSFFNIMYVNEGAQRP